MREARLELARSRATHTREEWEFLRYFCYCYLFEGHCPRCGKVVMDHRGNRYAGPLDGIGDDGVKRWLVKDHVRPLHLVEDDELVTDGIDNLQPICQKCNGSKGSETVDYVEPLWPRDEEMSWGRWLRKQEGG